MNTIIKTKLKDVLLALTFASVFTWSSTACSSSELDEDDAEIVSYRMYYSVSEIAEDVGPIRVKIPSGTRSDQHRFEAFFRVSAEQHIAPFFNELCSAMLNNRDVNINLLKHNFMIQVKRCLKYAYEFRFLSANPNHPFVYEPLKGSFRSLCGYVAERPLYITPLGVVTGY